MTDFWDEYSPRALAKRWSSPDVSWRVIFVLIAISQNITMYAHGTRCEGLGTSGVGLARSLIAINHCQNSATRRTTRAAGYYHQSRVLRDQRDARRARGQGRGPSETRNPVRYFRKLGPTALLCSACIHTNPRVTSTNTRSSTNTMNKIK